MITSDLVIFKGLLKHIGQDEQFDLLQYTAESERNLLGSIELGHFDPKRGIAPPEERLKRIHYSWFVDLFSQTAHADRAWLCAVLPDDIQERLLDTLPIPKRSISPFGKQYLGRILLDTLTIDEPFLLPVECLPPEPLIGMLDLSIEELIDLVNYLGLHDVSPEIRTLINASALKKIEAIFSQKQKEYLKLLLGSKEPVLFAKLQLNDWDGNGKKLKEILHQRGLNRLAKTLYGKHPSFIWHLLHAFDIKRAKTIKMHLNDLNNKAAHDILNMQMQTLLNFMTVERSS